MPSGSAPRIAVVRDAVLTNRQTERVLCSCSQCNGMKLTPARFESHIGSRRKSWKLIVKVKGADIKLDDLTQCDGCEIWVHTKCIKTYTEEELKNIKYFCPACMAKGKMKATTVIPSAIDETRCENEDLKVELYDRTPVYIDDYEGLYLRKEHMLVSSTYAQILCNCSQCNGTKLTPTRFESHTGSRRKNWKLIVEVKGIDVKLDDLLTGKKPGVAKTTQRNAPVTMKQKVEELLQEPYSPVHARWTTEMCAVCRWIEDWDYNKIIIYNRCQVVVHQECYGARDVNDLTSWVCRACEEPQVKRHCCLCPIKVSS